MRMELTQHRFCRLVENALGIDDRGQCRRYAPKPKRRKITGSEYASPGSYCKDWPLVGFEEWCGEFKGEDYEKGED